MKEKYKLGWKVVRQASKGMKSAINDSWYYAEAESHRIVKYSTSRWTKPKRNMGPLAVFRTRASARTFKYTSYREKFAIYKCKYIPSKKNFLADLYQAVNISCLPEGTALADKVKLLYRA